MAVKTQYFGRGKIEFGQGILLLTEDGHPELVTGAYISASYHKYFKFVFYKVN